MANRTFYGIQSTVVESKVLAGSFEIAASGGVATKKTGVGYTVAKSATGEYTITLSDRYYQLISAVATVEADTAVDLVAQIKSTSVDTDSPSIVVNLNAGATPTEPAAITKVNFVLIFTNLSIKQN